MLVTPLGYIPRCELLSDHPPDLSQLLTSTLRVSPGRNPPSDSAFACSIGRVRRSGYWKASPVTTSTCRAFSAGRSAIFILVRSGSRQPRDPKHDEQAPAARTSRCRYAPFQNGGPRDRLASHSSLSAQ